MSFFSIVWKCQSQRMILPVVATVSSSFISVISLCEEEKKEEGVETKERYDYVVIGYGRAGKEAHQVLKSSSGEKIGIIDPKYNGQTCCGIKGNVIELESSNKKIEFTKGVLLSTGVKGAIPPLDCIMMEKLHPSYSLHQHGYLKTSNNNNGSKGGDDDVSVVLGTSEKAMNQVLKLLSLSSNPKKVVWMYGVSGPLSYMVPKYLSMAIAKHWGKKLYRKNNFQFFPRTLIRYIDDENSTIYMTPWMDTMDSIVLPNVYEIYYLPYTHDSSGMASSNHNNTPWNHLITNFTTNSCPLTCTYPDGRIVVNSHYMASKNIYAAGSVAVMPNISSWKKAWSGTHAARAMLMSNDTTTATISMKEDVNDEYPLTTSPPHWKSQGGIEYTSIGNTSVDHCYTHGFWWTNTQLQRRFTKQERSTEYNNNNMNNNMVYGQGIIYYFDSKTGQLVGILTWNIPNINKNHKCLEYMKQLLLSNGTCLLSEEDKQYPHVLQLHHLQDASQRIIQHAFAMMNTKPSCLDKYRPLYKFTAPQSTILYNNSNNISMDHSSISFFPSSNHYQFHKRPPSLQYYPSDYYTTTTTTSTNMTMNARPKKEEPLWLSSPTLYQNQKQYQQYQMFENLRQGQFANNVDPMQFSSPPPSQ